MQLSDTELQELIGLAHEFAEKEIRPVSAQYDESKEYPWDVFYKAAEVGLTCFDLPEEYGGGGVDNLLAGCRIYEELAWGDPSIATVILYAQNFVKPLMGMGSDEQKQRWIPQLCSAKPKVIAYAMTEPGSGSDAAAMKTHARKVDGGYVLNGQKTWISNAPVADFFMVYATVEPGTRHKGVTCFVLERGDEGLSVGKPFPKLGYHCHPCAELFFEDCFVPEERRIGEEGEAFGPVMSAFDAARVEIGANSVGIGRAAIEHAVDYAKEREAFGKKISEFQAVAFRLVDAKMKVDQARLVYEHAARLHDTGKPFVTEASMAKLAGAEAAWFATWAAVQTLGGYGYSSEYPVEKLLRDAKAEEIYEGTSDIQRLIIARSMFRG